MNVYLHELKVNKKFVIIWLCVMMLLGLVMTSFYPAFVKDVDAFISVMNGYPESIRAALGMNIETFGSILGFYSSIPLTFLLICATMEGMILGVSILSKEIREKTADFLLSKPINRNQVVTSKILASLTLLGVSNIILFVFIYIMMIIFTNVDFSFNTFALLTFILFIVQLLFFAIGILIAAVLNKIKAVLPISMGVVLGFYVLGIFGDEKLRILMPFKYFDTMYILKNNAYELGYIIFTLLIIIVSIMLTYIIYKKKDIHSV